MPLRSLVACDYKTTIAYRQECDSLKDLYQTHGSRRYERVHPPKSTSRSLSCGVSLPVRRPLTVKKKRLHTHRLAHSFAVGFPRRCSWLNLSSGSTMQRVTTKNTDRND
eukprot:6199056-Pleurochrysis_carterae.AAC.2